VLIKYKGTMPANTIINNIRADTIAIADNVFLRCTGLTGITIPASVTSIDINVFSDCTGLTSIIIPASVTSIGGYVFNGWTSSQTINIQGKANQAAADSAWGANWRANCLARIVYQAR